MVYRIIVKPEAEQELREALEWYDEQREGLGSELYNEVLEVMERIENDPQHFQKRYKDFRISFTKRFRYGIHFIVEGQIIYIHAILHTSMKPRG